MPHKQQHRTLPKLLIVWATLVLVLPAAFAQRPAAPRDQASRAQVRFAVQLIRADGTTPIKAGQVIGAPVLTTLDGSTGSISVSGGDISYTVSLSPTLETDNNLALLWNLQLSGKALPGATTVNLNGASRIRVDKEEPVADLALTDPKTGTRSSFRLQVTTSVTQAAPSK